MVKTAREINSLVPLLNNTFPQGERTRWGEGERDAEERCEKGRKNQGKGQRTIACIIGMFDSKKFLNSHFFKRTKQKKIIKREFNFLQKKKSYLKEMTVSG